jgi:hypothetical protein
MTLTHSARKEKAKRLQKWVMSWVGRITGLPTGPDEDVQSRQMGQTGVDIPLSPAARKLFPFSVECKNCETWSVPSWIEQARANMYTGTNWLLVLNRNNKKPVVVLDAGVFFSLLERLQHMKRVRSKE